MPVADLDPFDVEVDRVRPSVLVTQHGHRHRRANQLFARRVVTHPCSLVRTTLSTRAPAVVPDMAEQLSSPPSSDVPELAFSPALIIVRLFWRERLKG